MAAFGSRQAWLVGLLAAALLLAGIVPAARADSNPTAPGEPATVTGDPLPTVQINGVVWSQVVVGNKVFAAGNFTSARPAGAPAGTGEVPRTHLLAYDITTGELDQSFNPVLNGQVLAIAKSPDNSRIYIGGQFTSVNGSSRWRVAAFNAATGALIGNFAPNAGTTVRAIAASSSQVYFGGDFKTMNNLSSPYLAAVNASDGKSLAGFSSTADASVTALTLNPAQTKLVVGGRFTKLGGGDAYGMGAVDPATGALSSWPINTLIRNAGTNANISSLSADGDSVYGTGYTYGGGGNFEGTFRADGDGNLIWVSNCRGDHYSTFAQGGVVYDASHSHYCGDVPEGFAQSNPWDFWSSSALTKEPTGQVSVSPIYYPSYSVYQGKPAPTMLHWYPVWSVGAATGQKQAGWTVAGDDRYVVYGGEFPAVNGKAQQGLVRFAKRDAATNKTAPARTDGLIPQAMSATAGEVRVGWQATFDRDNRNLEYRVYRNFTSFSNTPVYRATVAAKPWERRTLSFTDTGLTPGSTQTYRVYAFDADGNNIANGEASVVVAGAGSAQAYAASVLASSPEHWFRMDDPSGTRLQDSAGSAAATAPATITGGASGALASGGSAISLSGTSTSFAATEVAQMGPQVFTVEAWVKTSTNKGGRIIGYGDSRTGRSRTDWTDRHLYLDNSGRVYFGVDSGGKRTLVSSSDVDDNRWHHLVGTLGADGMRLYIDGQQVGSRTDVTSARAMRGHWRIGGDTLTNWTGTRSSDNLTGSVDEAAVYYRALSAAEVQAHYQAASGVSVNQPPVASFTDTVNVLTVALDASASTDADGVIASYSWTFPDGSTATGATVSKTFAGPGSYPITLTVTDNDGATGTAQRIVVVDDPGNQVPVAAFTASANGLEVAFNSAGSSDPDGSVAGYSWDFGDGTTSAESSPVKLYAAAGSYVVSLTATDAEGAVSAPATVTVTVASVPLFAADAFNRTVASGWGTADIGGAWTTSGTPMSVGSGAGVATASAAGRTVAGYLNGVSALDQDITFTATLDKVADGGGSYINVAARGGASSAYRAKVWVKSTGGVQVQAVRLLSGVQTTLLSRDVAGLTVTPDTPLKVRVQTVGANPTTFRIKVWTGATEPAAWNVEVSDSTAALQAPAGAGLMFFVSGTASNAPVTLRLDDWVVAQP